MCKTDACKTELDAISERISRRVYLDKPFRDSDLLALEALINKCNREAGLSIRLIRENGEAFQSFFRSYGMFQGVRNYFALVGRANDLCLSEKAGYYGERLVLEATRRGLGTCWVGGTFDPKACPLHLAPDEVLVCLIAVGPCPEMPGKKERFIYKAVHRRTKTPEQLCECRGDAPEWFFAGVRAVQKAPSALNKQPVLLTYDHGAVTAQVPNYASHQAIDLGIAKLHFELASGGGQWKLGNGASFRKA